MTWRTHNAVILRTREAFIHVICGCNFLCWTKKNQSIRVRLFARHLWAHIKRWRQKSFYSKTTLGLFPFCTHMCLSFYTHGWVCGVVASLQPVGYESRQRVGDWILVLCHLFTPRVCLVCIVSCVSSQVYGVVCIAWCVLSDVSWRIVCDGTIDTNSVWWNNRHQAIHDEECVMEQ